MDPDGILRDQYSSWMGLIYIFNLIVGTGALTLPSVFAQAGWALGIGLISIMAFMSYITVTFVIESTACANAIVHWKRLRLLKKDRSYQDSGNCSTDDESSDNTEDAPLFHNLRRYYDLDRKLELGEMATLFFNRSGCVLFYICFAVYLYGDLAIYSAAVSKSLADISCTYRPNGTDPDAELPSSTFCWSNSRLTRLEAYKLYVGAFILTVGPFVFFNVQKTKYLQLLTSIMRWLAFLIMTGLAIRIIFVNGPVGHPKAATISGMPALFGACVYSFMCHHSLPGLIAPVRNKQYLKTFLSFDYLLICAFYIVLALTGAFAFDNLNDLYTLNFIPSPTEHANAFFLGVQYFLALFPVFTLSTSFPIIAITLKNNLTTLFLDSNRLHQYHFMVRDVVMPLLAIIPPVLAAFFTENVKLLVSFTGSYGGTAIQYLIPAYLVYYARKMCSQVLGQGILNEYRSPFGGIFWIVFVVLWSVTCVAVITVKFFMEHWRT